MEVFLSEMVQMFVCVSVFLVGWVIINAMG